MLYLSSVAIINKISNGFSGIQSANNDGAVGSFSEFTNSLYETLFNLLPLIFSILMISFVLSTTIKLLKRAFVFGDGSGVVSTSNSIMQDSLDNDSDVFIEEVEDENFDESDDDLNGIELDGDDVIIMAESRSGKGESTRTIDFDQFELLKNQILEIIATNNNSNYYIRQFESIDSYVPRIVDRYMKLKESDDSRLESFVHSINEEQLALNDILTKLTQNSDADLLSDLGGVRSRLQRLT